MSAIQVLIIAIVCAAFGGWVGYSLGYEHGFEDAKKEHKITWG